MVSAGGTGVAETAVELRVVPRDEFGGGACGYGLGVEVEVGEIGEAVVVGGCEGRCYRGHGEEEVGAQVGVEALQEAEGHLEVDGFFDVEI